MKDHSGKLSISHNRKITIKKMTNELLGYLEKECIAFLVYVDQGDSDTLEKVARLSVSYNFVFCTQSCLIDSRASVNSLHLKITDPSGQQIRRGSIAAVNSIDSHFRDSLNRKLEERRVSYNFAENSDEQLKVSYKLFTFNYFCTNIIIL